MESLNYHHLRYFWMVAREGSLKKASERMNISQPTISAQVAALEESLGQLLFRRSGRSLVLTEAGRRAFTIAEEIFTLGEELIAQVRERNNERPLPLHLGLADSLPKLVSWEVFSAVFNLPHLVHLVCHEGNSQELLADLAAGQLDLVISDEPAPSSLPLRAINAQLGESPTNFCAVPALAKKLLKSFPASLDGAPMLLPTGKTAWRHELEAWFLRQNVRPRIIAEFDDAALLNVAGAKGLGVAPIPARVGADASERYGLQHFGTAEDCILRFYGIAAQRRISNPAVAAIMSGHPPKES
ncbi:MAG: LysR family transcriptional regulator [Verrucomicrobiales bacterium]|nr:LysR family transcriptional regulator [Verrucomicrobiales bacterium]